MQGRIITTIKDIWETLKKELGGIVINDIKMEKRSITVEGEVFYTDVIIKDKIKKEEIKIRDMRNDSDIVVKDGIVSKVMHKVSLLEEEFSVADNKLIIEKKEIIPQKIELDIFGGRPEKIEFKNFLLKIEDISFHRGGKRNIISSRDKILYLPKKIKSVRVDMLSPDKYEELIKKIKNKMGNQEVMHYKVEALFEKIPIKNLKNLKYFNNKNEIELYFNSLQPQKEEASFIILKNKINNEVEKIFV